MLQVIKLAQFRNEYMHHHVTVVHCYPVCVAGTLHEIRLAALLDTYGFTYGVLNGQRLVGGTTLTNNKIAAYSIFYAVKVNYGNALTLALLNTFNDAVNYAFSLFLLSHLIMSVYSQK